MSIYRNQRGFTLIELLVVIAIIGILSAVVLASLGSARENARKTRALADMRNIHTAMEMMYTSTGIYLHGKGNYCPPVTDTDNEVEITPTNLPQIGQILDPWGNSYWFDEDYQCTAGALGCNGVAEATPRSSVLVSCGPDNLKSATGCTYNDDNIVKVFCKM